MPSATESRGWLAGLSDEKLRARTRCEPYAALWERLGWRTREQMRRARAEGFPVAHGALAWLSITPMVMEAALIHRLEGDADCLRYVEECIDHVVEAARKHGWTKALKGSKLPALSHAEVALAADLCRESLGPRAREALLTLMREIAIDYHHGAEPYIGYAGGGNIQLCQSINAAVCAAVWGADCAHPSWEQTIGHAVTYVRCYLRYGCDAQGYGYEGTGYSYTVFHYIYLLAGLLNRTGRADLYATEPNLRNIPNATFGLLFPDRSALININDMGLLLPESLSWLLGTAAYYGEPRHLGLWYAYQGPDHPTRPFGDATEWYWRKHERGRAVDAHASMLQSVLFWDADAPYTPVEDCGLPAAGYSAGTEMANFRTSWSRDAVYLNVLGSGRSHASQTHKHADCGHFSVCAGDEYLAIDTGRYNVDEDQHNVVMVDGKPHLPCAGWGMNIRGGRLLDFQRAGFVEYVRADMAHMKDCIWADRHFLFVRLGGDSAYIVTIDNINKDNARHAFWWQLHAHPSATARVTGERQAVVEGRTARLDVTFAVPTELDFPKDPHRLSLRVDEAFWSWPYGRDDAAKPHDRANVWITSVRRPRLIAEVEGLNGQIMAVIAPRRAGDAPLTVRQVANRRVLTMVVESEAHVDTIAAPLDSGVLLTPDMRGFTELAVVRRDKQGKLVAQWSLGAERLTVGEARDGR